MNACYVVLIEAHTTFGALARRLTGYPYTHIAVSMDASLTNFYTYARRHHFAPLDAGFMVEHRDYYAFGKYRWVRAKVFRVPVTKRGYRAMEAFLSACANDPAQRFNLLSMLTMPLLQGVPIRQTHTCMSFVATLLQLSGAVSLERAPDHYDIPALDALLAPFPHWEGSLRRVASAGYAAYMRPCGLTVQCKTACRTIGANLWRWLTPQNRPHK